MIDLKDGVYYSEYNECWGCIIDGEVKLLSVKKEDCDNYLKQQRS